MHAIASYRGYGICEVNKLNGSVAYIVKDSNEELGPAEPVVEFETPKQAAGFIDDRLTPTNTDSRGLNTIKCMDDALHVLWNIVCEELPEDWELRIVSRHNEAEFVLIDPDGNDINICLDDLGSDGAGLAKLTNHARYVDGLAYAFEYDHLFSDDDPNAQ